MGMRGSLLSLGAATAALVMVAGASTASASFIQNGSFEEDGGFVGFIGGKTITQLQTNGGWDVYEELPGWGSNVGSGIEVQSSGTVGSFQAYDGDLYVELDSHPRNGSNSNAYQKIVNLDAGRYILSYAYSWRTNKENDNGIEVQVMGANGAVLGPMNSEDNYSVNNVPQWQVLSYAFDVAIAGDYEVSFLATGEANTLGGFIDDVKLTVAPLPAAAWFLLTALGGLFGSRWLRKGGVARAA
ncbi:VPLPA-CTERM sorting domain-containing protein [Roseospira navarrensis]|uniref:DUF642 domain-containing protein n=1 Tax=Roseospira navarrensis TaxID=140058 RepID=A0A7X1ZAV7_9PROT|nr:VPLPA-CTERM sorting domain-containing protein [Roseospira navarrensis]MQX35158.1 hypothetical protein [Roseospira navarrensis]